LHSLWALPTRLALGKIPGVADVERRMAELEEAVASAGEVQSRAVPTEGGMRRPGTYPQGHSQRKDGTGPKPRERIGSRGWMHLQRAVSCFAAIAPGLSTAHVVKGFSRARSDRPARRSSLRLRRAPTVRAPAPCSTSPVETRGSEAMPPRLGSRQLWPRQSLWHQPQWPAQT
jgi:hypothetical protein